MYDRDLSALRLRSYLSTGKKEQKSMKATALAKKSYLEPHPDQCLGLYFLIFSCVAIHYIRRN